MLFFVYASFGGNTERFVEKVAKNYLRRAAPCPQDPETIAKNITFVKLNEPGEKPHDNMTAPYNRGTDLAEALRQATSEDAVVFFVPTYGEYNHQKHCTENYVPQQFFDFYSRHVLFNTEAKMVMFAGGNRTFGTDFAKATHEFPPVDFSGQPFELSGTPYEVGRTALFIDEAINKEPATS